MKKIFFLILFEAVCLHFSFAQCTVPATPGSIISNFPTVCKTQTYVPYSISAIPSASSYLWTYTGTGVTFRYDSTNYVTIDFSSDATSGILTVKGVNSCGSGNASPSYSITVSPLPGDADSITGTSVLCQGSTTVFYSVPATSDADYYEWTYSGTGAIISGSTNSITIDFLPTATSGILTVRGGNNCTLGTASPDFPITVNLVPQGSFTGNTICTADSRNGQLSFNSTSGSGPYTVIYNDGIADRNQPNVTGGIAFDAFNQPSASTTYTLVSVSTNNCSRSSGFDMDIATIAVSSQGAAITSQPSDTAICEGNDASFQISASRAYSYEWRVSTNAGATYTPILSAGSNPVYSNFLTPTLSISGISALHSGYKYKCLVTAACGSNKTSAAGTLNVNPLPETAGIITGLSRVCQKQNGVTYVVPPIANADNYIWDYSGSGATLTTLSNSVTVNFSSFASSGYITVKGSTAFCTGAPSGDFPIGVILSPTSAGLITGSHVVCQNQTAVAFQIPIFHSHSSFDEPTFTWAYSGTGASISGPTNPMNISFSDSATSGVLTVMRTQTCGNGQISPNYTITVNPAPAAPEVISDTLPVCIQFGHVTYSVTPIPNASKYLWTYSGPNTIITDSSSSLIINGPFTENAIETLTVQGINATCQGPVSNSYPIVFRICVSDIEENVILKDVSISPNPSSGIFNLLINNAVFSKLQISICDVLGKEVFSISDKNNSLEYKKEIDLEGIPKGIYYVKLIADAELKTFKISIQ